MKEINDVGIGVSGRAILDQFVLLRLKEAPRTMLWLYCRAVDAELLADDKGRSSTNERRMDRCLQRLRKAGQVRFDRNRAAWVLA